MMINLQVSVENAPKLLSWLQNRGGIAVWRRIDFSQRGDILTPTQTEAGLPTPKPDWSVEGKPSRIVNSTDEVSVSVDEEIKRFHVGIRTGDQGLRIKLTDGATRKVRAAVEKAGEGAYHVFDYETQEAVIMKPTSTVTLTEWDAKEKAV